MKKNIAILIISLFGLQTSYALTYALPPEGSNVVGDIFTVYIEPGENLYQIARRYDMGYEEVMRANPHVNPQKPKAWTQVIIPAAFVLPDTPHEGIVVNLPEMRLYYYPPYADVVMTFPIGVGRTEWLTPVAKTTIIEKKENPEWNVPESIKAYMLEKHNVELPDIMPPGPENPLGEFAMRLGVSGYLIHGTNQPTSVGKRSSSGCIRMYPEDVAQLFQEVSVEDTVRIINQPYKAGMYHNEVYVEAHKPFWDQLPKKSQYKNISNVIHHSSFVKPSALDWEKIKTIQAKHNGYPMFINSVF